MKLKLLLFILYKNLKSAGKKNAGYRSFLGNMQSRPNTLFAVATGTGDAVSKTTCRLLALFKQKVLTSPPSSCPDEVNQSSLHIFTYY